ncbi:DUF1499 domain-containing protein [Methylocapsa acidiphila]|uniref:DUF1499 domain-containing protein n=1 Tax=Methylocapsa acidiphila TaxID=133552 RepID=UPI00055BC970|nr:DUF1499 domain-containing protein [Methylocapsa acidiphila]
MRRLIVEEPYSKAALLSWRLAAFSVAVALIGVVVARGGLDPQATLAVLGGAVGVAAAAILSALAAFVVIWRSGRKGAGTAAAGLFLALLLLAYPAYLAEKVMRFPRLVDLSTDILDPPAFSLSRQALAARGGSTPANIPAQARKRQLVAYPQVQPILLDLDAPEAYAAIVKAVTKSGWKIIAQTPPGGRSGVGHIDAIARSLILGFPCDVTLRIRPLAGQTRVDMRSVSRFALSDFGANQRNVEVFEGALTAEVDKADQAGR